MKYSIPTYAKSKNTQSQFVLVIYTTHYSYNVLYEFVFFWQLAPCLFQTWISESWFFLNVCFWQWWPIGLRSDLLLAPTEHRRLGWRKWPLLVSMLITTTEGPWAKASKALPAPGALHCGSQLLLVCRRGQMWNTMGINKVLTFYFYQTIVFLEH